MMDSFCGFIIPSFSPPRILPGFVFGFQAFSFCRKAPIVLSISLSLFHILFFFQIFYCPQITTFSLGRKFLNILLFLFFMKVLNFRVYFSMFYFDHSLFCISILYQLFSICAPLRICAELIDASTKNFGILIKSWKYCATAFSHNFRLTCRTSAGIFHVWVIKWLIVICKM